MNRSPVVIAATVAGLALALGFRPGAGTITPSNAKALTTGNANISGAQTVVGSDQALAGGLGDIQVKVTAANGRIVSVGMAKMNLHGPQSAQISNNVIPQLQQQTVATNGGPIHAVSGATYTSKAYATSLQAALDQLKGGPNAALAASNGNGRVIQPQGGEERD
ncbi:MAG: FMN-binding protein [Actinobacteria bacterium]|nr:FMN-binding protein [Actinomycetota bacterium]